jgi:hypothetical protein
MQKQEIVFEPHALKLNKRHTKIMGTLSNKSNLKVIPE